MYIMVKLSNIPEMEFVHDKKENEKKQLVVVNVDKNDVNENENENEDEDENENQKTVTLKDEDNSIVKGVSRIIELGVDTEVKSLDEYDTETTDVNTRVFMCCYGVYGEKNNPYLTYLMHTATYDGKTTLSFPYSKKDPSIDLKRHSIMACEEFFGEKDIVLNGYIFFQNDCYVFIRLKKLYSVYLNSEYWYNVLPTEIINHEKCINMDIYKNIVQLFTKHINLSFITRLHGELYSKNVMPFPVYKYDDEDGNVYDLYTKEGSVKRYVCHLADQLYFPIFKESEDNKENVLWEQYGSYMIKEGKVTVSDPTNNLHRMS